MADGYTPTERRILSLLSDWQPHARREVRECLYDDMGALRNIRGHLSRLRRKIEPNDLYISCELYRGMICYRLIRVPQESYHHA